MSSSSTARVLLVIDSLAPGGAERSTVALIPQLVDRGFELELATLHSRPGLQDEVRQQGVLVHELAGRGARLSWLRSVHGLIEDRRPDLVHTVLYEADLAGRCAAFARGVPVVSSLVTERYGSAHLTAPHLNKTKVRLGQLADAATARLTRRLHAVSEQVADSTAKHLRYPRDRIDVVYRGRPAELADQTPLRSPAALRRSLGVGDRQIVLVAARHDEAKGIDRIIEAWPTVQERVPDSVLLIAGQEGQHTPVLREATSRLGIETSVEFLGHRTDVDDLLRISDAFVLPSRREGLPGSLLEAMAAGTPAVVSDLPQIREVVSPDSAVIVDADDAPSLGAGVARSLCEKEQARQGAARARQRFLDLFTLDRSADGMAAFYRTAMGR